jgi:hypothetical protein
MRADFQARKIPYSPHCCASPKHSNPYIHICRPISAITYLITFDLSTTTAHSIPARQNDTLGGLIHINPIENN